MPETVLEIRELRKSYLVGKRQVPVLRGINLAVAAGEFIAIVGPSGCGKSTLLFHMGGMLRPESGAVLIAGQDVSQLSDRALTRLRRDRIGFVFQRFNLIEVLTARQNVELSLGIRGLRDHGQIDELFAALGVSHVAARKPGQMSIGEQQRVAVARALAHRPQIVLADEPTGNLDSASAADLLAVLRRMNHDGGQTLVMITHSAEAAGYADRVVHMRDGKLLDH